LERQLSKPHAAVWRAITDPEEQRAWFPGTILTEGWKVGAELTFRDGVTTYTGTVLDLNEPHRCQHSARHALSLDGAAG